jgi:hypothetical protein
VLFSKGSLTLEIKCDIQDRLNFLAREIEIADQVPSY